MLNQRSYARFSLLVIFLFLTGCATWHVSPESYAPAEVNIQRTYHPKPNQDVIGKNFKARVHFDDTVSSIAKRYDVGYRELEEANPSVHFLFPGRTLTIPRQFVLPPKRYRHGIVINVPELRLYYFDRDGSVSTYPVSLGREGWHTPLGKTIVYRKEKDPIWWIPKSIREIRKQNTGIEPPRKIEPGPENPLGRYAIYLAMNGYLIHGTNDQRTIGLPISAGCVRMYNRDVADLFNKVNRGTPVNIIYYPVKAGWDDGRLYIEAHKEIKNVDGSYQENTVPAQEVIRQVMDEDTYQYINWQTINKIILQHAGIPAIIAQKELA